MVEKLRLRTGKVEVGKTPDSNDIRDLSNQQLAKLRAVLYGQDLASKLTAGLDLLKDGAKPGEVDWEYFTDLISADEIANQTWKSLLRLFNSLNNVEQQNKFLDLLESVKSAYDRAKIVNKPLLNFEEVPEFPSLDVVMKSMLNQLTPAQVVYMMEEGRVPFGFQVKLVAPSSRIDLIHALLDGQPKKMNTRSSYICGSQKQEDLNIWKSSEKHLTGRNDGNSDIEWRWSLYQDKQVFDEVEGWDDLTLTLEERVSEFRVQCPEGMKGTDRFNWAMAMADGLEAGKPMDIYFPNNATNIEFFEQWQFTVLDEEGEFTKNGERFCITGAFGSPYRGIILYDSSFCHDNKDARLRAGVDGPIEF